MEWNFRINWQALVEEAKLRRRKQKLTQVQLGLLTEISTPTISRFESGDIDIQVANALKIFQSLGMIDQRMLTFPEKSAFVDASRLVVAFTGQDKDKTVVCKISREALEDHFEGNNKPPLKVFTANQERIEHEARRKYLAGELESDGSILVKTEDINN